MTGFTVYLVTSQDTVQRLPGNPVERLPAIQGLQGNPMERLPSIKIDGIRKDEVQGLPGHGVKRGTHYGVLHIDLGTNTTKEDSEEEWWNN